MYTLKVCMHRQNQLKSTGFVRNNNWSENGRLKADRSVCHLDGITNTCKIRSHREFYLFGNLISC
jgi:hypothetical protein